MDILYIVTEADNGGAQKYVLTLARHFAGKIAAGQDHQWLFDEAKKSGLTAYALRHLKRNIHLYHDFLCLFEIYRLVKKLNPDIVHLNSSKAGLLGGIVAKLAGKKVIFTAHGFFFFENTPALYKFGYILAEKFASFFRNYIITVSDHDRLNALKYKIISPDKIKTIHNGLPPINFLDQSQARKILNTQDEFVIGTIAQYYHRKGLDVLIDSISLLPKNIQSKIKVILIGDGPEKENLSNQIQKLRLTRQIKLAGNIPDAATYLKAFDIFVLSSRVEGFPFVLLEALRAGLPIIATSVGGNKEAIGDAGTILPDLRPDNLSKVIQDLINEPARRERYALQGLERSAQFSEVQMLTETEEIYHLT